VNTCLYCGRPLDDNVKLRQLLTGYLWRIPQDLVPFVCSGWSGRQYKRLHRPMRLAPYEGAR
jgi:hypothetical protein